MDTILQYRMVWLWYLTKVQLSLRVNVFYSLPGDNFDPEKRLHGAGRVIAALSVRNGCHLPPSCQRPT